MTSPIRLTAKGVPLTKGQQAVADTLDTLQAARDAYQAAAPRETEQELRTRSTEIRAAMQAASDAITVGAVPCPACGGAPHGRVKTPAHEHNGATIPALYEIRCLACPSTLRPKDDAPDYVDVVEPAARAYGTPADAVAAWNAGVYVTTVRHA